MMKRLDESSRRVHRTILAVRKHIHTGHRGIDERTTRRGERADGVLPQLYGSVVSGRRRRDVCAQGERRIFPWLFSIVLQFVVGLERRDGPWIWRDARLVRRLYCSRSSYVASPAGDR